jgi:hypothetical protein
LSNSSDRGFGVSVLVPIVDFVLVLHACDFAPAAAGSLPGLDALRMLPLC